MTANEMREELLLLFDNLLEYGAPAYDDFQISTILTKAQLRVFRQRYDRFESTEKLRQELAQLIKPASVSGGTISESSDQTGVHPNGTFFDLPSDFQYFAEEGATTATSSSEVKVKPVTHDEYTANIGNTYKKPTEQEDAAVFWRMDISRETQPVGVTAGSAKRSEVITAGSAITDYRIRYISTPPDIVVDSITASNQVHSILDESLHPTVVDEAYKIAKAATRPEEYQIALNERKDSEN